MRRTRLRPVSKRRRDTFAERTLLILRVHERDVTCQARTRVPEIECGGPLDVHEIIPRSVWPRGELVEANCTLVCRSHHDWIGDNPVEAHRLGLHAFSWERSGMPKETPQ